MRLAANRIAKFQEVCMQTIVSRCIVLAALVAVPFQGALAGSPRFRHHNARLVQDSEREHADHYSDKGAHPSKAERLGVAVQSRALLDKTGKTDFELTTGQLDSSAVPPGNIDNIKLRVLRTDGKKAQEKEHEHLRGGGGYFHTSFMGLARGQRIDVKAKVTGFGHGREAVEFKLQDVVQYRPDLAVQTLDYATLARPNTAVQFSAVVAERMGDLGAHADCELVVNGQTVDSLRAIWVDARSAVTCRFSHRFASAGKHNVAVRVRNVVPGAYDTSANSAVSGEILVDDPATIFYTASASERTDTIVTIQDSYYAESATVPDQHAQTTMTSAFQGRHFSGSIPKAVNLPVNKVSYSDASDGKALSSLNFNNLNTTSSSVPSDPAYTHECNVTQYDEATAGWLTLRRYYNADTGKGLTTVDLGWDAGDVTYVSEAYCRSTVGGFQCDPGDYTINQSGLLGSSGIKVPLGSSYSADVVVDDGTAYSAHPSMQLTTSRSSTPLSGSCFPVDFGGPTSGKMCFQFSSDSLVRAGSDAHLQ
jgi:hypothetical protein